mmetsp:Transcript_66889/g.111109  ORF Transcript_66889/g.111109 Transcript_66889/m.111109 type:complete len:86 (+) Transcript_66889:42-299(+)
MSFFDTCCMYFCSGLSAFAVATLFFLGAVLLNGGGWYLDISEEESQTSATACFFAGSIYLLYLVFCMLRIGSSNKGEQLDDEPPA